jgi:glycopeptide antibiotics resistance protein
MKPAFIYIRQLDAKSPLRLGIFCLVILLILIVAGLWPFNFLAKNKVAWLPDQRGVHFYGQSIMASSELRNNGELPLFPDKSITMEIHLRPLLVTSSLPNILTLYDGRTPDIFFIGQWRSDLIIKSRTDNPAMRKKGKVYREIGINNVLIKDQDCLLTITSAAGGTAVYINGKLSHFYANYHMLAGMTERPLRLVLGNSPSGKSYWTGHLMGLAVYNRVLSIDQVLKSYESWTTMTPASTPTEEGCLALYSFKEGKGTMAHSEINSNDMLIIPERFKPIQRKILSPFLLGYQWNLSALQDVTTNIFGFIPFGFFFSALIIKTARTRRLSAYLIIVVLGTGLSVAIEMTQAYLPMRDSSLTDVVMNSAGTILGIVIFQIFYKSSFGELDPKDWNLRGHHG